MSSRKPMYPRDGAGSFKIPSTRGEAIKTMCSLGDRLEIYTPNETFIVRTPNHADPARTNPHAPWTNAKTHDVGSASPIVARTLLTADSLLKLVHPREGSGGRDAVLKTMHSIKETLLQCDSAKRQLSEAIAAEAASADLSFVPGSRAVKRFPQVQERDAKVTAFLIPARRCITEICSLVGHFFELKQSHSNLEYLVRKELEPQLGAGNPLTTYLASLIPFGARVLDLRNGQEHAVTNKGAQLAVHNFRHKPDASVARPAWQLGEEEPVDIEAEMRGIQRLLLDLAEGTLVGCIDQSLPAFPPLVFRMIQAPDEDCPIRYQLDIDLSRVQFPPAESA